MNAEPLKFFVFGVPATQGSKIAFKHPISGKVVQYDSNTRNPQWRAEVAYSARMAMKGRALFCGAVEVSYTFFLPRPKKDFKRGQLRSDAPRWPIFKMDWEKMARSVGDAMTGFVYEDDGQACHGEVWKRYADDRGPGVEITVNALE